MIRAGVFIGVDKTGNLQKLHDAARGARRMHEWALAQGMSEADARLITDEGGKKVSLDLICTAIEGIINGAGVDQLIVYFAGHGIYHNYSERWLLSDAPQRTSAAINVLGSVELARQCGIKHVVFISDACRMAAADIQALNVQGSEIFPNEDIGRTYVDQFFACSRGKAAIEYKDSTVAASTYTALFTSALLDALNGTRPEVLEPADVAGDPWQYIKPPKLDTYLRSELPRRVKALDLQNKVSQDPDAIVIVGGSWIARINQPVESQSSLPVGMSQPNLITRLTKSAVNSELEIFNHEFFDNGIIKRAIQEGVLPQEATKRDARIEKAIWEGMLTEAPDILETTEMLTLPFGPQHFETECGVKVHGARITGIFAPGTLCELMKDKGDNLYIHTDDFSDLPEWGNNDTFRINTYKAKHGAINILLRFEGGFGTVIPVIPGYIVALNFDKSELVNVAYEPSDNTRLWKNFSNKADRIRILRAVAASSSRHSRFSLDQNDALQVAQSMQYEKKNDPTLSIYAAYAYSDLQEVDRIQRMARYQQNDLEFKFFDLALLGRQLTGLSIDPHAGKLATPHITPTKGIVPFVPLLSQGWALLKANRVTLHPALSDLEDNLLNSLWSLYDADGLKKLKQAMQ